MLLSARFMHYLEKPRPLLLFAKVKQQRQPVADELGAIVSRPFRVLLGPLLQPSLV